MDDKTTVRGVVFGIQRFSIHDGPGIRTTVFLKGCNLHCSWCHNPEGIPMKPIVGLNRDKCTLCGACQAVCPKGCHEIGGDEHSFARKDCEICAKCVDACPMQALEIIGKTMTAEEVFDVIIKDKRYYDRGGGVTVTGGEAMLQKEMATEIFRLCKNFGIHCALETNGMSRIDEYRAIMPYVDLFLIDYKASDPEVLKKHVGGDMAALMSNIKTLSDEGAKILVRCPIIPGINDVKEHFDAIARLTRDYPALVGAEILPYHKLGVSKAKRVDMAYTEYEMPSEKTCDEWKRYIGEQGGRLVNAR